MKIFAAIFLLALACSVPVATAARADSAEDFIQGTWRAGGTDPSGRHGWFQEWTFDKGKFKETGYQVKSRRDVMFIATQITAKLRRSEMFLSQNALPKFQKAVRPAVYSAPNGA